MGGLSPEHQELLNIILHESGRINNVIEQMLSFGNISVSRKPSAMNLNDVLDNCVRIINRQKNGKQIDMDVALDPSIPTLIADNGRSAASVSQGADQLRGGHSNQRNDSGLQPPTAPHSPGLHSGHWLRHPAGED